MFAFERHIEQLVNFAPVNTIQTGFVYHPSLSTDSGESLRYHEVKLDESPYTPVDVSKSICYFDGKILQNSAGNICLTSFSHRMGLTTIRFEDSSTLWICSPSEPSAVTQLAGRWWVIEFV